MDVSTSSRPGYLGVDMSKDKFDAAMCIGSQMTDLGQFPNEQAGWQALATKVAPFVSEQKCDHLHLVMEPTGSYHLALMLFAFEQGWLVSLPNPVRVRSWADSEGIRVKTDALDSRVLARYGENKKVQPEALLPEEVEALNSFIHRREELKEMLQNEYNRRHALSRQPRASAEVKRSVERIIRLLEEELAELEEAIEAHIRTHQALHTNRRLLLGIPGIGKNTVLHVMVFLYRWQARTAGRGTAKGLTAFAGLDARIHKSGKTVSKRAHISKMGCGFTRRKLFMAARGGVRAKSGPLRQFYDRLRGRHKPYKLVITAAARKMLVWAFMVFSRQEPFNPELATAPAV
jgi:transposase